MLERPLLVAFAVPLLFAFIAVAPVDARSSHSSSSRSSSKSSGLSTLGTASSSGSAIGKSVSSKLGSMFSRLGAGRSHYYRRRLLPLNAASLPLLAGAAGGKALVKLPRGAYLWAVTGNKEGSRYRVRVDDFKVMPEQTKGHLEGYVDASGVTKADRPFG